MSKFAQILAFAGMIVFAAFIVIADSTREKSVSAHYAMCIDHFGVQEHNFCKYHSKRKHGRSLIEALVSDADQEGK